MDFATRPNMAHFGPGAPDVPAGWAARFNDQYQTWFYVNTHTSQSQWEPPAAPALAPSAYQPSTYYHSADEELARRLQAEEDARAGAHPTPSPRPSSAAAAPDSPGYY